jgi:DNA-binding NarL/FixJ family response regulator
MYRQGTGFDPHCTPVLTRFINGDHIGCKLNEVQKQVMLLIGEGYSSEQIAAKLHKGIDTIHLLPKKLYPVCGVETQIDLFKCGVRCSLIKVER